MSSFMGQLYNLAANMISDSPNETSGSPNETSGSPNETSGSQWGTLRIVIQEAEDDRKKLQNLKENNHELCKTYLDHLRQDLATPDECQSVTDIKEQLQKIQEDLERIRKKASDKVVIEFVGATSSGKSTLLNALTREERLPAGFAETTMCLIEVYTTDDEEWSVKVNGTTLSKIKDNEDIKHLLTAMSDENVQRERSERNIDEGTVVRVGWPKRLGRQLPENVVLVDSPGYGEDEKCDKIVKESCQKADIIVAVMDSMSPSKGHVTRLVKEVNCQYAFGVFTKWDEVIQKHEKEHSQISLDCLREKNKKKYLESINSHDRKMTSDHDHVFFVDSQHVFRKIKNESSFPAQQFLKFESKLSTSAGELKRKSLKQEVKKAAEKVEKNCEEFQKIMVKRKDDKLTRLDRKIISLKDGGQKFIDICRSLKAKITEEIGDRLMQDVIKRFLKDIENGNLSEQEAFKNLCDTVNKQMKLAIANVTTNANEELKEWDHLMANFSNLSESKFSAIECEASQFNIGEELPDDKYNPWTDPWSYFTGNFAKSAGFIAVAAAGGGLGFIAAEATFTAVLFSGLGGTGGGAAGFGAGFGLDKIVKKFWPISERKLKGWKLYLEEELKKLSEDNVKLIDNEIEEIEGLKRSELGNAESKFQREKDWLNDKKHPLNQWSNELDSRREEAKSIREENDRKL